MRIHVNDQEHAYLTYWQPMQERLGDSLTEFIRHFLMRAGAPVRQGDVYFTLKAIGDEKAEDEIIAYLQEITEFSAYYEKLISPGLESDAVLRARLLRLNRIEVTVAYPLLLNLYSDFDRQYLSREEFADILDILENFMIRRFVCGVPTYGLNKVFPPLHSQAKTDGDIVGGIKRLLSARGYPRDAEFRERFSSSKIYAVGERIDRTKLILERLEESYEHKEPVDFSDLTVEHVMPQTLTSWWRSELGESADGAHELLLNTMGNLTLTGYNPRLSNGSFPEKQGIYLQSHLELNKYFETTEHWNEDAIRRRADVLAASALRTWQYFGSGDGGAGQGEPGVTGTIPAAVIILGERFQVASWRDVARITLKTIADLDEEKFDAIVERFPRVLSRRASDFRTPGEIVRGAFMEMNLGAAAIHKLCVQAADVAGLSSEDWRVELQ